MKKYCSLVLYIGNFRTEIDNNVLLNIADKISTIVKQNYERFGFTVLHPNYAYQDIGETYFNSISEKSLFATKKIHSLYFGDANENPTSPEIFFISKPNEPECFSDFRLSFRFPSIKSGVLEVQLDLALTKKGQMNVNTFSEIVRCVFDYGYCVDSAYLHYYNDSNNRLVFSGGSCGINSFHNCKLINRIAKFRTNYNKKILGFFEMNAINTENLSKNTIKTIVTIVGDENVHLDHQFIFFSLQTSNIGVVNFRSHLKRIRLSLALNELIY